MKKQIKTKIKSVLAEEIRVGELLTLYYRGSEYCECTFRRIKKKYFDDKEGGRVTVEKIKLCRNCMHKAKVLRVGPDFILKECYINHGTIVIKI